MKNNKLGEVPNKKSAANRMIAKSLISRFGTAAPTKILKCAKSGSVFTYEEIIFLHNPSDSYECCLAACSAKNGHIFSVEELLSLGRKFGYRTGVEMILTGNIFTIEQLIGLLPLQNLNHNTLAHVMAANGYRFSEEEINLLGNPKDNDGTTISDQMHWHPRYTVDDLIVMGNPPDANGVTPAHFMAFDDYKFSAEDLFRLKNPHLNGHWTIAHIMIRHGHRFTANEIILLGNPPDENGETLSDYLSYKRVAYNDEERARLADQDELQICRDRLAGNPPPMEIFIRRPDLIIKYGTE